MYIKRSQQLQWLTLCSALVLSACATMTSSVESVAPKKAQGNEPFWQAQLGTGTLTVKVLGAEAMNVSIKNRTISPEQRQVNVDTKRGPLSLQLEPELCRDTMSGMVYPETATLDWAGTRYSGCAGEPSTVFVGPEWTVTTVAGQAVADNLSVTIQFEGERVFGRSGCNRYMGGYQLSGEGLSFGQIAGTLMACMTDNAMQVEQNFLQALKSVRRFDIGEQGELLLMDENSVIISAIQQ